MEESTLEASFQAGLLRGTGAYVQVSVPQAEASKATDAGIRQTCYFCPAGDRLLEVDGISFRGFSYHQAVDCLSQTGEVVT